MLGFWPALFAQPTQDKSSSKITLRVEADYLALHASGTGPAAATVWEYRLRLSDNSKTGDWTTFPQPNPDGSFQFDVPLQDWRWAELEVRASTGEQVLATAEAKPKQRMFEMLRRDRFSVLPEPERAAWLSYFETSERHAERERDVLAIECRKFGMAVSKPAPGIGSEFKLGADVAPAWYGSPQALKLADTVLSYQTPTGAWSKAVKYADGPRAPGTHWTNNPNNGGWHYCGTLDNHATTEQIKFLAQVYTATKREDAKAGARRGLEWLLTAQFPNGGWPQVYPVEPGYHEAITLNDGAMLHALEVLRSASTGEAPFGFLDETIRQRASTAFDKALSCLLACQVKLSGKPAVWCAQHDPLTLEPVGARLKEPPSLSGMESAELLKFLMRKGPVTPAMISAIEGGVEWLSAHRLMNLRKVQTAEGKTDYVNDLASTEVYWARFYDVESGQPIFAGAQDGRRYSTFAEMAQHNNAAYDYFTTKPADVVEKEFQRWKNRVQKEGK
jgi:PelA/Pel-15E family pectate lyase